MINTIPKLAFFLLFLTSCAHIEFPHYGIVKDADSGEPISGVVAHLDLESGILDSLAHSHTEWKDSYETITNNKGQFAIPLHIYGQVPFELSNGHTISFLKAGYFESSILDPSINNDVKLYKITHYLDYLHYKKSAALGHLNLPYTDDNHEGFKKYKNELAKTAIMQFVKNGDDGVFFEIPGARFTELSCSTDSEWNHDDSKAWTHGVEEVVCTVLDEASHKWMAFTARGTFIENYVFSSSTVAEVDCKSIIAKSILSNKTINSVRVGRSVYEHVLYVTTGDSRVYRLNLEGVLDFRILILTSPSSGQ
jgi:hypothetical protein